MKRRRLAAIVTTSVARAFVSVAGRDAFLIATMALVTAVLSAGVAAFAVVALGLLRMMTAVITVSMVPSFFSTGVMPFAVVILPSLSVGVVPFTVVPTPLLGAGVVPFAAMSRAPFMGARSKALSFATRSRMGLGPRTSMPLLAASGPFALAVVASPALFATGPLTFAATLGAPALVSDPALRTWASSLSFALGTRGVLGFRLLLVFAGVVGPGGGAAQGA
jgi:hypothetical protein